MADNSISVEGGLLPSDLLEQIATGDTQGQRAEDFRVEGSARLTTTMESAFSGVRKHWESYRRGLERSSDAAARTRITRERWMANLADELGYDELHRASPRCKSERNDTGYTPPQARRTTRRHSMSSAETLN